MQNSPNIIKQWALPNRTAIISYLEDLIAQSRSHEEVADWASQFILGDYDHLEITDWPAWEMLQTLSGADLKASPTTYLHTREEFEDWLEKLR